MSTPPHRLSACLEMKVDELFLRFMSEESNIEKLQESLAAIKSEQPLPKLSTTTGTGTAGEASTGRDAMGASRKSSPPPRAPSPSSPAASPKSSPRVRRAARLATAVTAPSIEITAESDDASGTRSKSADTSISTAHAPHLQNKVGLPSILASTPAESTSTTHRMLSTPSSSSSSSASSSSPSSSSSIPRFYFPYGRPTDNDTCTSASLSEIRAVFELSDDGSGMGLAKHEFDRVCSVCNLPVYWKGILFRAAGGTSKTRVKFSGFSQIWKRLIKQYHDPASRFVRLSSRLQSDSLVFQDLLPLIQCVVDDHPGLFFLRDCKEFINSYISTVATRIFYTVNRSWSGRISIPELRRSTLLSVIEKLETINSINDELEFFSYEHFYVMYCKFSEMNNHRRILDIHDLSEYDGYGLTRAILKRVLSKAVLRYSKEGLMEYPDFVCFMLAEEDKTTSTSIEYWFRCLDLDGDGVISMYEIEHFYNEQLDHMQREGMEPFGFNDCLCQLLDMMRPQKPGYITLRDLKACSIHAKIFFNTLFNYTKFVAHEHRDPFTKDIGSNQEQPSDWVKFASVEYLAMVTGEDDVPKEDEEFDNDTEDPVLMALAQSEES
eukprot:scpid48240/ scgid23102/ Serine/threonine-protein phosphatase 2A regulatory subunit B&apos; PP2A subunit B isoform PR72/PR130; PP2A subunit B isoform R3 isoform; PP2A subunit B isoforms B&apos; PP2A subunit B isoforms B72/B130; Serine/threonine-protein phosphatase 2A 72/130 kDa regulatory subunit B